MSSSSASAAELAETLIPQIHHEQQARGSMLCAQHALNALLQAECFDATQLADVARSLDELERKQLDDDEWARRQGEEGYRNMDDTGFFSVGVLEAALEVWGLRLVRWRSEAMRAFQQHPEEQFGFVLNLDSHWFTIRSFRGGWWFNLNSFLAKPSWIGSSYLGALLHAAETEGYSVFAVRPLDESDAVDRFQTSVADECAATLPPAATLAAGQGVGGSASGRPGAGTTSMNFGAISAATTSGRPVGIAPSQTDDDEDEAMQAALRESLRTTDSIGRASASGSMTRGVRRPRKDSDDMDDATNAAVSAGVSSTSVGGVTGAHRPSTAGLPADMAVATPSLSRGSGGSISRQAPPIQRNRRRRLQRGLGGATQDDNDVSLMAHDTDEAGDESLGDSTFQMLPSASGRRRQSRRSDRVDDEDRQLRRAVEASIQRRASSGVGTGSAPGSSASHAISIDDDEEDICSHGDGQGGGRLLARGQEAGQESLDESLARRLQRSPFLNPALGELNEPGELGDGSDGENSEIELVRTARRPTRRNDSGGRAGGDEEEEEDFHSASSGGAAVTGTWALPPGRDRTYDDEDVELQRALAASMADTGGGGDNVPGQDWSGMYAGEDDERLASLLRQARTPTPDDVRTIARKREEARRQQQQQQQTSDRPAADSGDGQGKAAGGGSGIRGTPGEAKGEKQAADAGPEEEEEEEEVVSPEEMRRRRLARFGA